MCCNSKSLFALVDFNAGRQNKFSFCLEIYCIEKSKVQATSLIISHSKNLFESKPQGKGTHLEKWNMHSPSCKTPLPSPDIPRTIGSVESNIHPSGVTFPSLTDSAQDGNQKQNLEAGLAIHPVLLLCEEVRSCCCECLTFCLVSGFD